MDRPHRPITADDYRRIYATFMALELKADGEEGSLAELLRHVHESEERATVPPSRLVTDADASREIHFAHLLLTALIRGTGIVPEEPASPMTVCDADGCPELTHGRWCLSHELDQSQGQSQ